MRLLSRIVPWLATCAGVLLVGAACSGESLLTEADASNAPLLGNKTVEVILRSSDMVRWRDTTYQGYAIPEDVPFQLVVNESDLEARALARFPTIPGTFELDTLSFTVDSFKNASFRLVIDTIRSTVDSMSYTVEAYALDQSFDGPTATWTQASLGVPWITPGGTLGQLAFPAMFLVYFWRRQQRFEAYVVGIWLCESLMYTAEYMADARVMQLPLVGGHIHDWNWLLARWGMLRQAEALGEALHFIASLGAITFLVMAARELKRAPHQQPTETPSAPH